MRYLKCAAGIVSGILVLASCGGDTGPGPTPNRAVVASMDAMTLLVGQAAQVTAAVVNASGDTIAGVAISWTVVNSAVATITNNRTVTGVSVGVTLAIATAGEDADTVTVFVVDQLTMTVEPADTTINVFGTVNYHVIATDGNGDTVPAPPVSWSSSSTSVATIEANGVATGVGVGFTDIMAAAAAGAATPALLQVTASAADCYGIASANQFQGSIAYGFKAVDQETDGGFFITADDNGSLHALMTQFTNTPFLVAWTGELSGASSASVTQKKTDGGTSISTYTSTSGVMMPQPALGGLPKLTLLVDLQHCTYRVVSGASLATLLTDQFGNQLASVDIVATIQFSGAVPPDWRNGGILKANGVMPAHSTAYGGLHLDEDALMPLGFAAEFFTAADPPTAALQSSGGFEIQFVN